MNSTKQFGQLTEKGKIHICEATVKYSVIVTFSFCVILGKKAR